MKKLIYLLCFAILLMLPGCVIDQEKVRKVFYTPSYEFDASSLLCPSGQCVAFVCNRSNNNPYTGFYPPPVIGSNCSFESVETEREYKEYLKGDKTFLRTFGAGFGSSFMEFADANVYCNNSLTYSVKWVLGNTSTGYVLPSPERATCFFEKSTLPVYILYAGGPFVPTNKVAEFAESLDKKGPAIVITEYSYNSSNPAELSAIVLQAKTIKQNCKNCLVAVYTKLNDDAILKELQKDSSFNQSVDLVAFGLDGRETPYCAGGMLVYEGLNFSRTILYNYTKPSFWAYLLVPRGSNENGMCVWNEIEEKRTYLTLFFSVDSMRKYGVIGFAPYSLYGNPLKCDNCTLMENGQPRQDPFSVFFSYCQQFYYYYNFIPVAFATKPGTNCSFERVPTQLVYLGQLSGEFDVPLYTVSSPMPYFYKCAACFSFNYSTIPKGIGGSGSGYHCTDGIGKTIDYWADVFEVDPDYMKAVAMQESGFDECAVSWVPAESFSGWNANNCNPSNLQYPQLYDPSGKCNANLQEERCWDSRNPIEPGQDPVEAGGCNKDCSSIPKEYRILCKPCAYGMFQVIDYPGYVYKERGMQVPDRIKLCGAYEYNPFNMNDSACARSYDTMVNAKKARKFVYSLTSSEWDALGITQENVGWWIALFTSYGSHGERSWRSWVSEYIAQEPEEIDCSVYDDEDRCKSVRCCRWDDHNDKCVYDYATCCGATNFFDFLEKKNCKNRPYGVQVLRKYIAAWKECGNCDEPSFLENFKKYHPKK